MLTAGEQWTRGELDRLRRAHFSARAQVAFLLAAQARANATRRERRALARQELRWILAGATAWLGLARWRPDGVFGRVRSWGLGWWALCAVMLDWHLGMLETPTGEPVPLGLADALTLARAWLVPAVAQAGAPWILLLGSLTDYGDGRVARATRVTRLGRDLEGLADACFFLAALHGAVAAGHLSPHAAGLERVRLAAGTAYASGAYLLTGHAPDPAVTRSGRCAAPIRSVALIAAGLGRRRWADRLLLTGTSLALTGLISPPLRAQMAARSARSSPPGHAERR